LSVNAHTDVRRRRRRRKFNVGRVLVLNDPPCLTLPVGDPRQAPVEAIKVLLEAGDVLVGRYHVRHEHLQPGTDG